MTLDKTGIKKKMNCLAYDPLWENSGVKRVHAKNTAVFLDQIDRCRKPESTPGVRVQEGALILPPRENVNYPAQPNRYVGGVFDPEGVFLAGSAVDQARFSCRDGYPVSAEEITERDETVIFGGMFYNHFGIDLLLSLTRFWYFAERKDCTERPVFLVTTGAPSPASEFCREFMALFHIPEDRYEILTTPTRFSRVIIPDEVLSSVNSAVDPAFMTPFHSLRERILTEYGPAEYRKLYVSRRKFIKNDTDEDGQNEEYYENFFERRGFTVIHPQEFPLAQQIRYFASADELVSTYGTLAHLLSLFAKPGARQVMLLRSEIMDDWFPMQAAILQMRDLDWYIVEAVKNPLPTLHDLGAFLYYPTAYFKAFLDDRKIPYTAQELESSLSVEQIRRYLCRWLECYAIPFGFRRLKQPELFPMMQALYFHVTGKLPESADFLLKDAEERKDEGEGKSVPMPEHRFALLEIGDRYIAFTVGDSLKEHRGLLSMDSTGAMIFRYLRQGIREEDLIARVAAEFPKEDPGDVAEMIRAFMSKLTSAGLTIDRIADRTVPDDSSQNRGPVSAERA